MVRFLLYVCGRWPVFHLSKSKTKKERFFETHDYVAHLFSREEDFDREYNKRLGAARKSTETIDQYSINMSASASEAGDKKKASEPETTSSGPNTTATGVSSEETDASSSQSQSAAAVVAQSSPGRQSGGAPSPKSFGPKPCSFFGLGTCRHGDQCRFSHNLSNSNSNSGNNLSSSEYMSRSTSSNNLSRNSSSNNLNNVGAIPNVPPTNYPPPYIINVPPGTPVYSIDVECVATGKWWLWHHYVIAIFVDDSMSL